MKQQSENTAKNKAFPENSEIASILDYKQGVSFCLNEEDFYIKVLTTYVTNNRLKELEDAYKNEDWAKYIVAVHAVKGTTKTIGGLDFSNEAKALEYAGKAQDYEFIKSNHNKFIEQYKRLMELIREFLEIEE